MHPRQRDQTPAHSRRACPSLRPSSPVSLRRAGGRGGVGPGVEYQMDNKQAAARANAHKERDREIVELRIKRTG